MRFKYIPPMLFSLVFLFVGASSSQAQFAGTVFIVNDPGDSSDASLGDGVCMDSNKRCTLRAAIQESNSSFANDAIIFDLPQPSVINLTIGEIPIVRSVEIVGPGARLLTVQRSTAAGTPMFRIFRFPPAQNRVKVRSISISNGDEFVGGGVYVQEGNTVGFYDCAITGNHSSTDGGGIANLGTLTIQRTLISSNRSENRGGGISNASSAAIVSIYSSTLTANRGSIGGALYNEGLARLVNDTISLNAAGNGSSIFNGTGNAKVMNTIIGRDILQPGNMLQGPFESFGNNIITNSEGSVGFVNGINNDQVSNNNSLDPMLGPLSDNGGQTDTMALLTGSPAIGNGNPCVITSCFQFPGIIRAERDQRRYRRVLDVDIGAYEQVPFVPIEDGDFAMGTVGGSPIRYVGSLVILTNVRTLEKKYTRMRLDGSIHFQHINGREDYVMDVKAKRAGWLAPLVIPIEF